MSSAVGGGFQTWKRFQGKIEPRQVVETGEAKLLEELWRGGKERRAPDGDGAAYFINQAMGDETGERPVAVDATNGFDLAARDWLSIGDDCQGLQGSSCKFGLGWQTQEYRDIAGVFGRGDKLYLLTLPLHAHAALRAFSGQSCQRSIKLCVVDGEEAAQLGTLQWSPGNKEQAFEGRF